MFGCYAAVVCGSKDRPRVKSANRWEEQQMESSSPAKSPAALATLSFGLRRLDSLMLLTNV
jgi:hypothetical protein